MSDRRLILNGAAAAGLLAFPAAAMVGLLWRFPVPLGGYASGIEAVILAPLAVLFYMVVMGGVLVVAVFGAAVTWTALWIVRLQGREVRSSVVIWSSGAVVALLCALSLAGLEFVIGPW